MRFTLDKVFYIWDDDSGDRTEVGPDTDGLDLVEIRYRDSKGAIHDRITFPQEAIPLLIKALQESIAEPRNSDEPSRTGQMVKQ